MRSLVLPSIAASLVVALFAAPALAETLTDSAARVSVDVPPGWKSQTKGSSLVLMDQAEDVAAAFVVVDAGAIKGATKAATDSLSGKISNIKDVKEEKVAVNGMPGAIVEGDGRRQGKDIDWAIFILDTPNDAKDLMVISIAEDAKLARHKTELRYLFNHIKPVT